MSTRVPLEDLLDADSLQELGPDPSPARLRARLPAGWVPDEDPRFARRDLRLFFRQGWMLLLCLVVFGCLGASFLLGALPHGLSGILRLAGLLGLVWLAAGVAGPLITRALRR